MNLLITKNIKEGREKMTWYLFVNQWKYSKTWIRQELMSNKKNTIQILNEAKFKDRSSNMNYILCVFYIDHI